jgi:hypothetical protein
LTYLRVLFAYSDADEIHSHCLSLSPFHAKLNHLFCTLTYSIIIFSFSLQHQQHSKNYKTTVISVNYTDERIPDNVLFVTSSSSQVLTTIASDIIITLNNLNSLSTFKIAFQEIVIQYQFHEIISLPNLTCKIAQQKLFSSLTLPNNNLYC